MKVLFYSYPSAFQNPGGGEIQLLKTKEYLEKLGVEVKLFDQWNDSFDNYDIMHVFGSVKDCVGLIRTAKNKGIGVVVSSIFWSSFNRAIHEAGSARKKAELVARHALKMLMPALPTGRRKTMALADVVLPNSESEKDQLVRLFALSPESIEPVPNGIDARFLDAKPDPFVQKHGIKDFVLAVGRVEPRKNQLNLIKAMKGTGIRPVIIGDPVSDYMDYYKECLKEAGEDVLFLQGMDHGDELLSSAYAASKVFAAPGWFETPGLAALEAAAAGSAIAITRYGSTQDYFGEEAEYFDPSDTGSIQKAVLSAMDIREEARGVLKDRIRKKYLWDNVAEKTLKAYKKVLDKKG